MPIYKSSPFRKKKEGFHLSTGLDRLFHFFLQWKKAILVGSAGVLLVALVLFAFNFYADRYSRQAASRLYEKPWSESEEVFENYPRSDQAVVARLALGGKALQNKDWDQAISYYEPLTLLSSRLSVYRVVALQNLGLAWRGKGDLEKAATYLKRALEDRDNVVPAYTKFLMAQVLSEKGEAEKAKTIYEELSADDSWPELKREAEAKVSALNEPKK